jgi:hypothetical protein
MVSRWKVYVVIFTALTAAYAAYALWTYMRRQENYSEPSEQDDSGNKGDVSEDAKSGKSDGNADAGSLDKYDAKMYVMKVFDAKAHRKPDEDEIAKYSALASKKQIYHAILRDHRGDDAAGVDAGDDDGSGDDDDDPPPPPPKPKPSKKKAIKAEQADPEGYAAPMLHHGFDDDDDDGMPVTSISKKGGKVCLDKADVLSRLASISTEVKQFHKMIEMM